MSDLMLDVGQANEIKLAARKAGATNADLKVLSSGEMFARILPVLRGFAEVIVVRKHIIDLDADPFIPNGWSVEEHRKGGEFEWSPEKVRLHLSPNQKTGKVIEGYDLRKELEQVPVFNANLLDYLLANPHLIPEEWKGQYVFFWGTIYRDPGGLLGVRYLYWDGGGWCWDYGWLGDGWCDVGPALASAS